MSESILNLPITAETGESSVVFEGFLSVRISENVYLLLNLYIGGTSLLDFYFADKSERMKNKYFSFCLVTFTLSLFLFFWRFSKIGTGEWIESSVTKYHSLISRLKQSGEPSGPLTQSYPVTIVIWMLYYITYYIPTA